MINLVKKLKINRRDYFPLLSFLVGTLTLTTISPANWWEYESLSELSASSWLTYAILIQIMITVGGWLVVWENKYKYRSIILTRGILITAIFMISSGIIPWSRFPLIHDIFTYSFSILYGTVMFVNALQSPKKIRRKNLTIQLILAILITISIVLLAFELINFIIWQVIVFSLLLSLTIFY